MIFWYSAKVLSGFIVGESVGSGPVGCGAGFVGGGSGDAGGDDAGSGGSVDVGGGAGGVDVGGGGSVDVNVPSRTVKVAVVPPHLLVLVTVCPPGAPSGTVNASEILPCSLAVPLPSASFCVLSHDSVTDPELQ